MSRIRAARRLWLALMAIALMAFLLRLVGISFGLPYLYDPDEPLKVWLATNMVRSRTLSPNHYFLKPTFFMYVNALAFELAYFIGRIAGRFTAPTDLALPTAIDTALAVGRTTMPQLFVLGRSISALVGAATTTLLFAIGRRAAGRPLVGLLAALILAVLPIEVANSQLVAPDVYMVFFMLIATLGAWSIWQHGSWRSYLLAAVGVGLTVASKYNGGAILIVPVAAHFLRHGFSLRSLIDRRLLAMLNGSIVVFFLAVPYALLDWPHFIANVYFEFFHYSTGHPGGDSNVLFFYANRLIQTGGLLLPMALTGVALWWRRDRRSAGLLALFPIAYFIFINLFTVHSERMLLLINPYLALFAAYAVAHLAQQPGQARDQATVAPRARMLGPQVAAAVLLLLVIIWPLQQSLGAGLARSTPDSREVARAWIVEQIPAGTSIAVESYSPYVDPDRYRVVGVRSAVDNPINWYREAGVSYLLLSQGMFARFYEQPEDFGAEIEAYEALREAFPLVRRFDEGDFVVLLLEVTGE